MKKLSLFLTIFLSVIVAKGQIQNGSFENSLGPDLSGWQWTCVSQSHNSAPIGGGNWSIKVWGGNTQGCFPGYAFQKLPAITNGQSFLLSGWAYAQTAPPIGLYFGKTNNGVITLQAGDTTSSTSWTPLSVQSAFSLSAGDTAVVVLYGGLAGGPVQGYGYFDLINLQQATELNSIAPSQTISVFPNPFTGQTTLQTARSLNNATITLNNIYGQRVAQIKNVYGKSVTWQQNGLPAGLYFIQLMEENKLIVSGKVFVNP